MELELENETGEVTVKHFYLAAALYAQGLRLITVLPGQGRCAWFVFSNESGRVDQAIKDYFSRRSALPPRDCFEALGALKIEAGRASRSQSHSTVADACAGGI